MAILVIEGARLYLLKFLGEYNTIVFIGFVLLSLPLSFVNIKIIENKKNIIFANLAGLVLPLIVACYFFVIILPKLNLLVIIGSIIIVSVISIKSTKLSDMGTGGMPFFVIMAIAVLSLIISFSSVAENDLLFYKVYYVYMIATFAVINSDIFYIYKHRNSSRLSGGSIGGNGIFDGIWVTGFLAIMTILILYKYVGV
ncbi:DUF1614 domain-containing protein [Candidatus Parcubacteria bacterium]|nr:DUF1614 domain-containing protein [Candidatus Parcubacteria bacterium]